MWHPIDLAPHHEPVLCSTEDMLEMGHVFMCKWGRSENGTGFHFYQDGAYVLLLNPTIFQYVH
jgi:hypothetical protein